MMSLQATCNRIPLKYLFKMQIIGTYKESTESDFLEVSPRNVYFKQQPK